MHDNLQGGMSPVPTAGTLIAACGRASAANRPAQQALTTGQWAPQGTEQEIARDFWMALARQPRPHVGWPQPHTDAVLWRALTELSCWAAMIRLAMRGGNWPLETADTDAGDLPPSLPVLLTAHYQPALMLHRWHMASPDHGYARDSEGKPVASTDAAYDAYLTERIPGIEDGLAAADGVFTRNLSMTLFVASGMGDTDT